MTESDRIKYLRVALFIVGLIITDKSHLYLVGPEGRK